MKLDPGMHIGMHLVSFGKSGVTIVDVPEHLDAVSLPHALHVAPHKKEKNYIKNEFKNLVETFTQALAEKYLKFFWEKVLFEHFVETFLSKHLCLKFCIIFLHKHL
jgi:hypothetical protein